MTSDLPASAGPSTSSAENAQFEIDARAALIAEIKETADKLEQDQASRGDLKLLSRSLKELKVSPTIAIRETIEV